MLDKKVKEMVKKAMDTNYSYIYWYEEENLKELKSEFEDHPQIIKYIERKIAKNKEGKIIRNIDYMYPEYVWDYSSLKEAVIGFYKWCVKTHKIFQEDIDILERICDSSTLGYAFACATLNRARPDNFEYGLPLPSLNEYLEIVQKYLHRNIFYNQDGADNWKKVVDEIIEERKVKGEEWNY